MKDIPAFLHIFTLLNPSNRAQTVAGSDEYYLKMEYDFDEIIRREGSGCIKYDEPQAKGKLPLWVADMDFATPPFIMDALRERLSHPVLGYPTVPSDYYPMISRWIKYLHGWDVRSGHIRYVPGIVKGIGIALNCFLDKGDKVVIQPPVYHPFRLVPKKNGFEVLLNPLVPTEENGILTGYRMDLDGLESLLDREKDARALILSNPQNPAGICWTVEELTRLADICEKHGVLVISDEIHCEMAHKGFRHHPFASVSEQASRCSITFMAPSKTFNIAGVVSSYAVIPETSLRERYFKYLEANELDYPTIFAITATQAAYRYGKEWREQMLDYVEGNIAYLDHFLRENIPSIHCLKPQASFLAWLDFRVLGLTHDELIDLVENKAGLLLNDGAMFGAEGEGFFRINLGCPRATLEKALQKLESAISSRGN